ncbi:methionyl-tRNA formyltransferase [Anaerotignum lactatifermentans]|uniref:Methionyl-tRNA formyltransferase n=1 Tax=Anaerotignum lactatifermentans TaxID=160404 RepID=A0ABS2G959_9FIRM|nr:methionyl-tRNA formyltransferase [Anaerotignum lactatifermentans]MBM6829731.1 methionyl-tRNA formyltransferase [Anaerotignum lactatifermentans]MBM6877152.1 methionyl-tRNA formyltransferase [Anaerotignum lactatifermentans]MBM6951390.1 methionyl-tRNA formyltransferase [Anaerotignum lactatifermentans]
MRIVFMGTPDFAVPSLEALLTKHEVVLVVTQPDKPKGRGKKLVPTPVKACALEHGIPVVQPEKVREEAFVEELRGYAPDLIAVTAFGQILTEPILNMPQYGCINVHGSLLPKYRGAAPMQWSIIDGETVTGITTMYMAKGLDSGDMLLKKEVEILPEDTFQDLHDKMAKAGAELLLETLDAMEAGTLTREEQDHDKATYAPMITKETGHIDWSKGGQEIINLIRGLNPAPAAYTEYEGEVLKIFRAEKWQEDVPEAACSEILAVTKKGFAVKCGDGALMVLELQARGGKRMSADAYLRGHEVKTGVLLQ